MADIIPFHSVRPTSRVLVAAPDGRTRDKLVADATLAGCDVAVCTDLAGAAEHLVHSGSDVCLIDLEETAGSLDEFCESAANWRQPVTLLALASPQLLASPDVDLAGRFELLPKPCSCKRLTGRLLDAAQQRKLREENSRLQRRSRQRLFDEFVGRSEAAETLRSEILAAAEQETPLTIVGGRGSGTSHLARAVHLYGDRWDGPLIAVDCSLQSSASLEEELFGTSTPGGIGIDGRFRQAAGGTLVLENIEASPASLQKKLVEAIRRLSSDDAPAAEFVRTIAVVHTDPQILVEQDQLDGALCKLVCAQTIVIPALSRRPQDVLPLAEHFLHRLSIDEGRPSRRLTYDARQLLTSYEWPGNVCQLWNVVQRAAGIDTSGTLTADAIAAWLNEESDPLAGPARGMTLREMERKLIETTFNRFRGNREQTAQALKIGLRTLSGKLREYGYPPRGGPGSNAQMAQRKAA